MSAILQMSVLIIAFEKMDRGGLAAGAGFILAVQQPAPSLPGVCGVARSALDLWMTFRSTGSAGGAGVLQGQGHRALSVSSSFKVSFLKRLLYSLPRASGSSSNIK